THRIVHSPQGVAGAYRLAGHIAGQLNVGDPAVSSQVSEFISGTSETDLDATLQSKPWTRSSVRDEAEFAEFQLTAAAPKSQMNARRVAEAIVAHTHDRRSAETELDALRTLVAHRVSYSPDGVVAGYKLSLALARTLGTGLAATGTWIPSFLAAEHGRAADIGTLFLETDWSVQKLDVEAAYLADDTDDSSVMDTEAVMMSTHILHLLDPGVRNNVERLLDHVFANHPGSEDTRIATAQRVSKKIADDLGTSWTPARFRQLLRSAPPLADVSADVREEVSQLLADRRARGLPTPMYPDADVIRVVAVVAAWMARNGYDEEGVGEVLEGITEAGGQRAAAEAGQQGRKRTRGHDAADSGPEVRRPRLDSDQAESGQAESSQAAEARAAQAPPRPQDQRRAWTPQLLLAVAGHLAAKGVPASLPRSAVDVIRAGYQRYLQSHPTASALLTTHGVQDAVAEVIVHAFAVDRDLRPFMPAVLRGIPTGSSQEINAWHRSLPPQLRGLLDTLISAADDATKSRFIPLLRALPPAARNDILQQAVQRGVQNLAVLVIDAFVRVVVNSVLADLQPRPDGPDAGGRPAPPPPPVDPSLP